MCQRLIEGTVQIYHNFGEEQVHRIAIMDHGKILVNDTPAELKKMIPGGTALEVRAHAAADDAGLRERLIAALRAMPGVSKVDEMDSPSSGSEEPGTLTYRIYADAANALIGAAAQTVISSGAV